MAKITPARNTPLRLPDDPKDAAAILARYAQELERRLSELERKHAITHQQFETYQKLHP